MISTPLPRAVCAAAILAAACGAAHAAPDWRAQVRAVATGTVIIPGSSLPRAADGTRVAHTNFEFFVPRGQVLGASTPAGKYETPASLACVYGVTAAVAGCNPETLTAIATTGGRMIAVVDAFDDPTAAADLAAYSKQYGLPAIDAAHFTVAYASGSRPAQDPTGSWEVEESLDVQMAHALAPGANIVLVEAASANTVDLVKAEQVAVTLVAAAGGGEVSNSWGGLEYAAEGKLARDFTGKNVVAFAAAGDQPGVGVPSALPDVVSVGGTSINRTAKGRYLDQTTWADGGGGASAFIPIPAYQTAVSAVVGTARGTPDIAMVANPQTGVWVYDTTPYQGQTLDWIVVGGTSVASPAAAALVNSAGAFNASGAAELSEIYGGLGNARAFLDITRGKCGNASSGTASAGYDLCTGVGAPAGLSGK